MNDYIWEECEQCERNRRLIPVPSAERHVYECYTCGLEQRVVIEKEWEPKED